MSAIHAQQKSHAILSLFENVSKERSIRKKGEIIKKFTSANSPDLVETLKKVIKYATDDYIRFYINLPENIVVGGEKDIDDPGVWEMLDNLAARTGEATARMKQLTRVAADLSESALTLLNGILDKDLGLGLGEKGVNSIFPGLLTEFNVMLAAPFNEKRLATFPVQVEPKYDGMRVIARVQRNEGNYEVKFFTRSGRDVPAMVNFTSPLIALRNVAVEVMDVGAGYDELFFDGEVVVSDFNDTISKGRKDEPMKEGRYVIFDVMPSGFIGNSDAANAAEVGTQVERRALLEKSFAHEKIPGFLASYPCRVELAPCYLANSADEIWTLYKAARTQGMEGVIVKRRDGLYFKKRDPNWMKIKAQETLDLPIVGGFEGVGKYVGMLGGLIVDHKGVEVRVGGGFSDEEREKFWALLQDDLKRIENDRREDCELIDVMMEVEFQEETPAGSLRHPTYKRLRRDKKGVAQF